MRLIMYEERQLSCATIFCVRMLTNSKTNALARVP